MQWAVQPGLSGIMTRLAAIMAELEACQVALEVVMNSPHTPERSTLDSARDHLQQVYDVLRQRVAA